MSEQTEMASEVLSPRTPHLGTHVRREREFTESPTRNMYAVSAPTDDDGRVVPHQVFFRVLVGRAENWQACLVQRTRDRAQVPDGSAPDWVLGGARPTRQTDWLQYAPTDAFGRYWFTGVHRVHDGEDWRPDIFVGYTRDAFEQGTLTTIYYDDTAGDLDADDLVIEVAVVRLPSFEPIRAGAEQAEIAKEVSDTLRAGS